MLEALGSVGDFVGGIGVVVTLVYLAIQVRQNTAALRAASRQEVVAGMREHMRLRSDPDVARQYLDGLEKFPDQTEDERHAFGMILGDLALFMQGAFALHESGMLEDETYHAYLDFFTATIATPGGLTWWNQLARPIFASRMVKAVDARLARGGLVDLVAMRLPVPASDEFRPAQAP